MIKNISEKIQILDGMIYQWNILLEEIVCAKNIHNLKVKYDASPMLTPGG